MSRENEALGNSLNENEQAQLNYSPDTSLLLSLGADERMVANQSGPLVQALPDHLPFLGATSGLFPCESKWTAAPLHTCMSYAIDPQISAYPVPDHLFSHSGVFLGQNYSQLPVHSQFEPSANVAFVSNQTLMHSNLDGCGSNNISVLPVGFGFNPCSVGAQTQAHGVGTNIYVNKGVFRLSEAEDWTPNPVRLLDILSELEKLNEVICKLKDECDLPNAKPNLKRERNRLASKACRLKKKATHETNKIKLEGLELEFKLLVYALHYMSWEVISSVSFPRQTGDTLSARLREIQNKYLSTIKVAGDSDNFVKIVLERTKEAEQHAIFNHHVRGLHV